MPGGRIEERLQARTTQAQAARSRLEQAWSSCRAATESLLQQVIAERERLRLRTTTYVEGLQQLAPRVTRLAEDLATAFADEGSREGAATARFQAVHKSLAEPLGAWAEASEALVPSALAPPDGAGWSIAKAYEGVTAALVNQLAPEVGHRERLAKMFHQDAAELRAAGEKAIHSSYEEWCVRLSQVVSLARSKGLETLPEHTESAVTAALDAAEVVLSDAFEAAGGASAGARTEMESLRTVVEETHAHGQAGLERVASAGEVALRGLTWGQTEMTESADRLAVFQEGLA